MKQKRLKISKKKIAIFSVFVFIATIFWFLDALKREYTTKITYPVEFYNFPKGVLINSKYPNEVIITIKAHGYDIIGKTNIKKPIKINVSEMAYKDKSDNLKLILPLNKVYNSKFPKLNNIQILSIEPEQIIFKAIKVSTKKVPVKLNIEAIPSPLYMQSGKAKISPDSITISGYKKELDTIFYIETEFKKFENLNKNLNTEINLKKIDNINFSENKVSVILPIEKYTENEILIPVKVINCPDTVHLVTFPNEVKVTYKVALSKYNLVNANDFIIVADFKQTQKNKEKIQINIQKYPRFIKSLKVSPNYLEYIIKKNE